MGSIILLAFGACFFPALLACVAIMISRPEPRWLADRLLVGVWGGTEQNLALRASDLGRRLAITGDGVPATDQMSSSSAALGSRSGRSSTGRVNG
jgi:hypothetical protein